ncbi:MAG: DNA-binding response regulator [Bacteroidia bacterium]|nr:MAG: DNA-binding response regulator [Bacteroidia bacterium]
MNILIIEDEAPAARQLNRLIQQLRPEAIIHEPLDSIRSVVDWLKKNPAPDLILCDIQLSDGLSFTIFDQTEVKSPVIFTTAYDQFAIRAFKLNSIDYLLKPVEPEDLKKALDKYERQQQIQFTPQVLKKLFKSTRKIYKSRFIVQKAESLKSIDTREIAFFRSRHKMTFLYTFQGHTYTIDYTLNELEQILDPGTFFRLNRQYICSIDAAEDVQFFSNSRLKVKLVQSNDEDILVSRNNVQSFKEWMDGKD